MVNLIFGYNIHNVLSQRRVRTTWLGAQAGFELLLSINKMTNQNILYSWEEEITYCSANKRHTEKTVTIFLFLRFLLFFLCSRRVKLIVKIIFWCKNKRLSSLNLDVLQWKSNITSLFFQLTRGKLHTCAKMLNGALPLHAKFLFSYYSSKLPLIEHIFGVAADPI